MEKTREENEAWIRGYENCEKHMRGQITTIIVAYLVALGIFTLIVIW